MRVSKVWKGFVSAGS